MNKRLRKNEEEEMDEKEEELVPGKLRKIKKKAATTKWNNSEYTALISLVRQFGEEWNLIASKIPHKTSIQCMQKFKNSQRSAKKGNWSPEEDKILLDWVDTYGHTKWTECSKLIKGRCGKQCRERWVNILNPEVKKGNWSVEEQEKIFKNLNVHYTSWSSLSKILPGRTENSIKNYFYSSIRRLKSNNIINVLTELYIEKSKTFEEVQGQIEFLNHEILKFNRLSQLICFYLLKPHPEEENGYLNFLISILLGKEAKKLCQKKKSKPRVLKSTNNHLEKPQFQKLELNSPSLYIPKEKTIVPQVSLLKDEKINLGDKKYIFEILKKCAQQTNQKDLISVIKFLENQLLSEEVVSYNEDEKIKINLPFCWNCVANNCTSHKNIK
jgi:hypothetical protein